MVEDLQAADLEAHLAEPADTRALRGPNRRAKTKLLEDGRLREFDMDRSSARVPAIAPAEVRSAVLDLMNYVATDVWPRTGHRNEVTREQAEAVMAEYLRRPAHGRGPPARPVRVPGAAAERGTVDALGTRLRHRRPGAVPSSDAKRVGGDLAMRRWGVPLIALAAVAALAARTVVAIDQLHPISPPQPRLTSVPPGTIAQWGIQLAQVATPPYCDLQEAAASRGVRSQGVAHCPVSDSAAVATAQRGGSGTVLEARLAIITWGRSNQITRAQPAWIVVLHFQPGTRGRAAYQAQGIVLIPLMKLL